MTPGAYGYMRYAGCMPVVCKLDTIGMHDAGMEDVGVGGGLLSRRDLSSHEPGRGVDRREPPLSRADRDDRAAVHGPARRVPGDADSGGRAGGSPRPAAVIDARTAGD